MRIGIVSDIHLDVNKHFPVLQTLIRLCNQKQLDKVIIAGDFSSDYTAALHVIDSIKRNTQTEVHFVPGNHDLYISRDKDSKTIYHELGQLPECLATHPVDLGDWAIIGNTGWYDYSFQDEAFTLREIEKKSYQGMMWEDRRYFQWGAEDKEIHDFFLHNLQSRLEQFKGKNIISVTHVVPYRRFVEHKEGNPSWNYFSAFIGTDKIGKLYDNYGVKAAVFGHTHTRYKETHNQTLCLCRPLGYHTEWIYPMDVQREMEEAVHVLELP